MCNFREGFVNLREGFVVAPWRLREAFSKTRSAKASRSPLEGFAKASRRRHGRLHLETIRQIMTSPRIKIRHYALLRLEHVAIWHREASYLEFKLLIPKLYFEAKTPVFTAFLYRSTDQPIFLRILLFCPPLGYFFIYPTTWISRRKTRLVTVHA